LPQQEGTALVSGGPIGWNRRKMKKYLVWLLSFTSVLLFNCQHREIARLEEPPDFQYAVLSNTLKSQDTNDGYYPWIFIASDFKRDSLLVRISDRNPFEKQPIVEQYYRVKMTDTLKSAFLNLATYCQKIPSGRLAGNGTDIHQPIIYCGLHYLLSIRQDGQSKLFAFIDHRLPTEFDSFVQQIQLIGDSSHLSKRFKVPPFEVEQLMKEYAQLPLQDKFDRPPPIKEVIKFLPPKTTKEM
jgi:hypothetical protein